MNRWKCIISWLLIVPIILTNSISSYAGEEKQKSEMSNTEIVHGEASGDISSDASGDTSGEGRKDYVTIFFYDDGTIVKTVQIEKGSSVELWEPIPYSESYIFKGWYYLISETHGRLVTETTTYDKDMSLHAYWEHNPNWKGPTAHYPSSEEVLKQVEIRRETNKTRIYTYHAQIEFKKFVIKNNNKLSFKIRSDRMPSNPIELQYSTSKKFTKGKTKTKVIKRAKNKSVKKFKKVTIKKLKKNKTYYIRARVKSQYNGETFYSKWSKVKKVNLKKNS